MSFTFVKTSTNYWNNTSDGRASRMRFAESTSGNGWKSLRRSCQSIFRDRCLRIPCCRLELSQLVALKCCQAWGYTAAEAFGGSTSQCQLYNGYGNCLRAFVTVPYQCTNAYAEPSQAPVRSAPTSSPSYTEPAPVQDYTPPANAGVYVAPTCDSSLRARATGSRLCAAGHRPDKPAARYARAYSPPPSEPTIPTPMPSTPPLRRQPLLVPNGREYPILDGAALARTDELVASLRAILAQPSEARNRWQSTRWPRTGRPAGQWSSTACQCSRVRR